VIHNIQSTPLIFDHQVAPCETGHRFVGDSNGTLIAGNNLQWLSTLQFSPYRISVHGRRFLLAGVPVKSQFAVVASRHREGARGCPQDHPQQGESGCD
jgi:hypothetical protein